MKIGTDAVLLGAWTSHSHKPISILDIGAGTGILSLMLAQRSNAEIIEAVEIDDNAYEQCIENFENSPWSDRLFCYHASLLEFAEEVEESYDTIICNPPFYRHHFKSEEASRDLARFQDAMPFEHLIYAVSKLLSENGLFSVVLPKLEEDRFIGLAQKAKLYPTRICHVRGNPNTEIKRSLLEFSFYQKEIVTSDLVIEMARHQHTEDYIHLTKDFYLKM